MPDMRLESDERRDFSTPKVDAPKYPYGLRIQLTPEEVEKLGMGEAPEVGKKMKIMGMVEIVEVSKDQSEESDSDKFGFAAQITEMYLEDEDREEKADHSVIYGE